ncbi:MAG: hypothetical protein RLZZ524_2760 [Pseudomonadota bacterium]
MPFLLPRHLQAATRRAEPALPPGLWHTRLGRSAVLSAAAVLLVGIGLPLLAGVRAEDTGAPTSMLAGALLGSTLALARRWRGLAAWWRMARPPARPETTPGLGARFDQACRPLQAGLRPAGGRLVGYVSAGARELQLPEVQASGLLRSLEAAVRLMTDEASAAAEPALLRIDLDRLDGETGSHLRLRLSGGLRRTQPRCARHLRQLATRLGAQLDIVEQGGLLQVEMVLKLADRPD